MNEPNLHTQAWKCRDHCIRFMLDSCCHMGIDGNICGNLVTKYDWKNMKEKARKRAWYDKTHPDSIFP